MHSLRWLLILSLFSSLSISWSQDDGSDSEEKRAQAPEGCFPNPASKPERWAGDPRAFENYLLGNDVSRVTAGGKDLVPINPAVNPDACGQLFAGGGEFISPNFQFMDRKLSYQFVMGYIDDTGCSNGSSSFFDSDCPNKPADATCAQIKSELVECRKTKFQEMQRNIIEGCLGLLAISSINNYEHFSDQMSSSDGRFNCIKNGAYTADFKSCKSLVSLYETSLAAKQAMGLGHEIKHQVTQTKEQEKMADAQENLQAQSLLSAATVKDLEGKFENQNFTFFSTKAGAIGTFLSSWKGRRKAPKKCARELRACCEHAADFLTTRVFSNTGVKSAFEQELIAAVGEGVVAKMKSNALKDQAKRLRENAAGIEGWEATATDEDAIVAYCATEQGRFDRARCASPGDRVPSGTIVNGAAEFGNNGFGQIGVAAPDTDTFGEYTAEGNSNDLSPDLLGDDLLDFEETKRSRDFEAGNGGGARLAKNGPPAGGGGGGGAGGGAGGSPQTPRSSLGNDEEPKSAVAVTKSGGYGSSKGSGVSFNRNFQGNLPRSKEGEAKNPFAALGKGNKRNPASQVVQIDNKYSNLFDKISKRYGRVVKSKRLNLR